MFGIGMPELLLLLAIALIVLGPKKLPDLAKSLGRAMREFKKATHEFKESIQIDEDLSDVKKAFDDIGSDIKDSVSLDKDTSEFKRPGGSTSDQDQTDQDKKGNQTDDAIDTAKPATEDLKDSQSAPAENQTESRTDTAKKDKPEGPAEDAQ